jgi:hypothetical protein
MEDAGPMSEYGDTTVEEPTDVAGYDVDVNGDGVVDDVTVVRYTDGSQAAVVDTDHDGTADLVGLDRDGDGAVERLDTDENGDGHLETSYVDVDEDGVVDGMYSDTDGDGRVDVVLTDSDRDGVLDTVTYGDGGVDPYTLG